MRPFEDMGVEGGIVLWVLKSWNLGDVDWIDLTHDSDKWQMVVNAVMALRAS